ncbi:MAG: M1 family metallopeptidase, partial [Balneolaceae bacterium]
MFLTRHLPGLRFAGSVAILLLFTFCTPSETLMEEEEARVVQPERPLPYPVTHSNNYAYALDGGGRTDSGAPGEAYWQNRAEYDLRAELLPEENRLNGQASIRYINESPDHLDRLILELVQNLHKAGTMKKENTEITGGVELHSIRVRGEEVEEFPKNGQPLQNQGYLVDATRMLILLDEPIAPGNSVELEFEWSFQVPEEGAGNRMGRSQDNLFFISYWYPHVMVYDNVNGWFTDPFLGNAEFYHDFADYTLEVTLPDNWLVMGTGEFLNPEEVLTPPVLERYRESVESDEVISIVTESDLGAATHRSEEGTLTWRFRAEQVRDVAFSATKESVWDGARAPVGDLDGDGSVDYTEVHSFYRLNAPLWEDQAEYAQHSISFLSDYLNHPYPWPHMTSVEGAGIIRGGMEYPMITVMGSYNEAGPQDLHGVTAHEFAHMWVPMIVNSNERRFTWMDEGFTTFNTHQAMVDRYPEENDNFELFRSYLGIAGTDMEGPIMRRSDYHYPGPAYGIASYPKPASILQALKTLLGEEVFMEYYLTIIEEW